VLGCSFSLHTSLIGYKWFSKAVLSFSFLFILAESLKIHSKLQKNHKIENPMTPHE
jgi:hypothetical protein